MEDRPHFEIVDGAVVHPLIAPNPGDLSPTELIEIRRAQCWAYYLNGGGGDPMYFDPVHAPTRERER